MTPVLGFSKDAHNAISSFDRKKEAELLSEAIKTGLYQTAVAEIGALGLGYLYYYYNSYI